MKTEDDHALQFKYPSKEQSISSREKEEGRKEEESSLEIKYLSFL